MNVDINNNNNCKHHINIDHHEQQHTAHDFNPSSTSTATSVSATSSKRHGNVDLDINC